MSITNSAQFPTFNGVNLESAWNSISYYFSVCAMEETNKYLGTVPTLKHKLSVVMDFDTIYLMGGEL